MADAAPGSSAPLVTPLSTLPSPAIDGGEHSDLVAVLGALDVSAQASLALLREWADLQLERQVQALVQQSAHALTNDRLAEFQRSIDRSPQALLLLEGNVNVLHLNAVASRLLGQGGGLTGQSIERMSVPLQAALQRMALMATREGRAHEQGVAQTDGAGLEHVLDLFMHALEGSETFGEVQFIVLVVDRTERVQHEARLRLAFSSLQAQQRENRWLSAVGRSTQTLIVLTDPRCRVLWVNAAFERLTGYTTAELSELGLSILQGPDTHPDTVARMNAYLRRGEGFSGIEVLNYSKNGRAYWVRLDVQPTRNAQGELEGFVGVEMDVTAQRFAQDTALQAQARQRAFFDAAPSFLCVLGVDGRVKDLNAMARNILGEGAMGSLLASYLHASDQGQLGRLLRRALGGETSQGRCALIGPGEKPLVLAVQVAPISHAGVVAQLIVAGQDVSLEAELLASRAEVQVAKAANEAKTRFLSRVSHELRTPLNSLLGFAELIRNDLEDRSALNARTLQRLDQIEMAGGRLMKLLEQTLDLSRLEIGAAQLHLQRVPLQPLLQRSLEGAQALALARGERLVLYVEPGPLGVHADEQRLAQLVDILLGNAIQHNREGGLVHLSARRQDAGVMISVRDEGKGIAAEQLQTLFDPLSRGSGMGPWGGAGMSLTIARQLSELMKGRISATNPPSGGADFRIWLPEAVAQAVPPAAPPIGLPDRALKVLYVEDVASNVELLRQVLAGQNWELLVATTGLEGLEMAKRELPDLLLLDLNLPDIDGVELRRRLLQDPATAAIPCAALTADVVGRQHSPPDVAFDAWLSKPLRIKMLREAMAQLVRKA